MRHPLPIPKRRRRGFTLVEVLIAMGIFAVAMASLASMFLVAVRLQQVTLTDVKTQQAMENAYAIIKARGVSASALKAIAPDDNNIKLHNLQADATHAWDLRDITFPNTTFAPDTVTVANAGDRPYKIEILFRRKVDGDRAPGLSNWQVYLAVFAMEQNAAVGASATYTGNVLLHKSTLTTTLATDPDPLLPNTFEFDNDAGAGGQFIVGIGDQIIDEYGRIYTVGKATLTGVTVDREITQVLDPSLGTVVDGEPVGAPAFPTAIYHGKAWRADLSNPLEKIVIVEGVVR